jgi:hypothetical protein
MRLGSVVHKSASLRLRKSCSSFSAMLIDAMDAATVTVPKTVAIPNATLARPFILVIRSLSVDIACP